MTDRELLELAAKAASMRVVDWESDGNGVEVAIVTQTSGALCSRRPWQPLVVNQRTDADGDALRLAVKLNINIMQDHGDGTRVAQWDDPADDTRSIWEQQDNGSDPYAATRRAIVRAAAEIGKTK
jgi:hypothetical protein